MRRIIVLCLIVLVALACFTPAQAKGKERERPKRIQLIPAEQSGNAYVVVFSENSKAKEAIVLSECGTYRLGLFETRASPCFMTVWMTYDKADGSYGYILKIIPWKKVSVFFRR